MPSTTPLPQKKYRSSGGETVRRAKKQRFNPVPRPSSNATHHNGARGSKGKGRATTVAAKSSPVNARTTQSDEEDEDALDGEEDVKIDVAEATVAPLKKRKVTGGTGKKGKKFVESQWSVHAARTEYEPDPDAKPHRKQKKPKAPSVEAQKAQERANKKQAQLEAAKAIVAARTKAKKDQAKAAEEMANSELQDGRKRVSFA
ncbi:BZ3500_MvSof-1268-A1-R1_Chr4-4g07555 [Microbotryum saponariae]|uniref:BZ3500_MvSof-1268-A1-R1_Chr4-4g07555 protein n=1 Tax=Microbotryum saponariae TaxID=289078 RepID=A0A2X0KRN6_9BASI|nr:BZ3500_MvSof-1268-A1-R1_Chr4-4g07555 [Microbotryum saponariae]SDA07216.1 BZ3501_MvSof-1269-A2-R1_Chr4-3g07263 [Microbotryum saponariae]